MAEARPGTLKPELGRLLDPPPPAAAPSSAEGFVAPWEPRPLPAAAPPAAGVVPELGDWSGRALLVSSRRNPEPPSPTMSVEKSAVHVTLEEEKFFTLLDWLLRERRRLGVTSSCCPPVNHCTTAEHGNRSDM